MNWKDKIEFYKDGECILGIDSSSVPRKGETLCIRAVWYTVDCVSWAVDFPDDRTGTKQKAMTAAVVLSYRK